MNCKAKGTRNERRSIRLLEAAGYACTRAAASLGTFDIIAISSRDVVLCQVKTRDWPSTVEMEAIRLFSAPQNARKLVHRWRDGQRCRTCARSSEAPTTQNTGYFLGCRKGKTKEPQGEAHKHHFDIRKIGCPAEPRASVAGVFLFPFHRELSGGSKGLSKQGFQPLGWCCENLR